jgi:hypothetical protein
MKTDDSNEKLAKHLNTLLTHVAWIMSYVRDADPGESETVTVHVTTRTGKGMSHTLFPDIPRRGEAGVEFARRKKESAEKQLDATTKELTKLEDVE